MTLGRFSAAFACRYASFAALMMRYHTDDADADVDEGRAPPRLRR